MIILLQGFHVCSYGVIVFCGGSGCGGKWVIFDWGSIIFSESGGRFVSCVLCRPFRCSCYHTVFLNKVLSCIGPVSVTTFLLLLHHRVFEDIGLVNIRNKLRHFIIVGDLDVLLRGVVFPPCEVSSVGAEMLVGGVAPGGNKGGLCCHPFCICYNGPSTEVNNEC